jgi:hypothetical protein
MGSYFIKPPISVFKSSNPNPNTEVPGGNEDYHAPNNKSIRRLEEGLLVANMSP